MARTIAAITLVLACAVAGCGGKLGPISGTVTLDGNPLADASVTLKPTAKGQNATGRSNDKGEFTLDTGGKPGAFPGTYIVSVSKAAPMMKDGKRIQPGSPEYLEMIKSATRPEETPESKALANYSLAKSTYQVTIVAGTPLKLELKSAN